MNNGVLQYFNALQIIICFHLCTYIKSIKIIFNFFDVVVAKSST